MIPPKKAITAKRTYETLVGWADVLAARLTGVISAAVVEQSGPEKPVAQKHCPRTHAPFVPHDCAHVFSTPSITAAASLVEEGSSERRANAGDAWGAWSGVETGLSKVADTSLNLPKLSILFSQLAPE